MWTHISAKAPLRNHLLMNPYRNIQLQSLHELRFQRRKKNYAYAHQILIHHGNPKNQCKSCRQALVTPIWETLYINLLQTTASTDFLVIKKINYNLFSSSSSTWVIDIIILLFRFAHRQIFTFVFMVFLFR